MFLKKIKQLKIGLVYNPTNPLLFIYSKKTYILIQKSIHISLFRVSLLLVPRYRNNLSVSVHQQTNGLCVCAYIYIYIYEHIYCSAIKENEILPFAAMWVHLESIMLSEMSDREKQMQYSFIFMWNVRCKTKKQI